MGQTYDDARLPASVCDLADQRLHRRARRAHVVAGQRRPDDEAYRGRGRLTKRFWLREGVPGQLPAGTVFNGVDTTVTGLMTSWRAPDLTLRLGVLHAASKAGDVPFVERPVAAALSLRACRTGRHRTTCPARACRQLNRIHNTFIERRRRGRFRRRLAPRGRGRARAAATPSSAST
ncbi:MAG: hypothetical protein U1F25_19810 [Rubrivivax sp.]